MRAHPCIQLGLEHGVRRGRNSRKSGHWHADPVGVPLQPPLGLRLTEAHQLIEGIIDLDHPALHGEESDPYGPEKHPQTAATSGTTSSSYCRVPDWIATPEPVAEPEPAPGAGNVVQGVAWFLPAERPLRP